MNYSDSVQLTRIENLLQHVVKRLDALEFNSGGNPPVQVPNQSRPAVSASTLNGRHPQLPRDRNPDPNCPTCHGVGLSGKCRSCHGKGGEVKCSSCNGNGKDLFDKKSFHPKRCTFCNGRGWDDCTCKAVVEGQELCECAMTADEKKMQEQMKGLGNSVLQAGMGNLTMGIGMMPNLGDFGGFQ